MNLDKVLPLSRTNEFVTEDNSDEWTKAGAAARAGHADRTRAPGADRPEPADWGEGGGGRQQDGGVQAGEGAEGED